MSIQRTGTTGGVISSIFRSVEGVAQLVELTVDGTEGYVKAYSNVGTTLELKSKLWNAEEQQRVNKAMKKLK